MRQAIFRYVDGPVILEGDNVLMTDAYDEPVAGVIAEIFQPGSNDALGYAIHETGGIVIDTEDGESFTWSEIDSHLVFVSRKGDAKVSGTDDT